MTREKDIQIVRDSLKQADDDLLRKGMRQRYTNHGLNALSRLTATPSSEAVQKVIDHLHEHSEKIFSHNDFAIIISALRSYVPVEVEALKKEMAKAMFDAHSPMGQFLTGTEQHKKWKWDSHKDKYLKMATAALDHLKSRGVI